MKTPLLITLITLTALPFSSRAADALQRGFAQPPESTKPWCYWYWITDNISRQGITKDLEVTEPFTARSLVLWPAERAFAAQCELQAAAEDGVFRTVREFPLDRSNTNVHVGPNRKTCMRMCKTSACFFRW